MYNYIQPKKEKKNLEFKTNLYTPVESTNVMQDTNLIMNVDKNTYSYVIWHKKKLNKNEQKIMVKIHSVSDDDTDDIITKHFFCLREFFIVLTFFYLCFLAVKF